MTTCNQQRTTNNFGCCPQSFKRIVDEHSQYYVLSYQSNARHRSNWDYREITVKLTKPGLDGVRVQARKGYAAR